MVMIWGSVLLIIGFILLLRGADVFVDAAVSAANKMRVSPIIIGTTLVAIGTSAPEAAISITAALQNADGISIGNIIGSNITNIFLILGLTALIGAPRFHKNTQKYELPFMGMITLLLCLIGLWFGTISRGAALLFLGLFTLFIVYTIIMARKSDFAQTTKPLMSTTKTIIMGIAGLAAVVVGADLTVKSATDIAIYFGASQRIIGLTLVAFGTSLPELVVSITAALKREYDMAIGNIVGSNIFNILFVLGVAAIIHPVLFQSAFITDGAIALLAVAMLMIFSAKDARINRIGGAIFVCSYVVYLIYLFF